jgi:hypothetical protein
MLRALKDSTGAPPEADGVGHILAYTQEDERIIAKKEIWSCEQEIVRLFEPVSP